MKKLYKVLVSTLFIATTSLQGQWYQTFGGSETDYANSVQQTTDGGYIILGYRLIKTDSQGNIEWDKNPHGIEGKFVQQTTDDGYIIVGNSNFDRDDRNVFLIKTDSHGNKVPLSDWN